MPVRYQPTSHETFSHDSIDSLGYDWERIAQPGIAPRFPFKVYLPRSTDDVVRAVREARQLGQRLRVRSKGHSSNDLVLEEGGSILCTEKLNRILALDMDAPTVTVQAGAVLAAIDAFLAEHGLGLPVIGDHDHITAGGFASVGGIGPASHRYGLFVDNVRALAYVTWDGEVVTCSRTERPDQFHRVLTGLGRSGVIVTLTLDLVHVDKWRTLVQNDLTLFRNLDRFIDESYRTICASDGLLFERGVWLNIRGITVGQFSRYSATRQSRYKAFRNRLSYGYLHGLGYWAGRLPRAIDMLVKYLGIVGIIYSPRFATIKNVEVFADKVLDSTVGDPMRMLIVLAPRSKYRLFVRAMYDLCVEARYRTGCFTIVSLYVKAITSPYLAQGRAEDSFCELMLYVGIDQQRMTEAILSEVVGKLDELCVQHGAFRYMHTKTSVDLAIRARVDPNAYYAGTAAVRGVVESAGAVAPNAASPAS